MHKNCAVAFLSVALGALVAGAQTTNHYEARDGHEAPVDETEEQEAPQEVQAPAKRVAPRVIRMPRPGDTHAEPNTEESASEPDAAISGDGQSLGGQGMGIQGTLESKPIVKTAAAAKDGDKANAASAGAKCEIRKIPRPAKGRNEHCQNSQELIQSMPRGGMVSYRFDGFILNTFADPARGNGHVRFLEIEGDVFHYGVSDRPCSLPPVPAGGQPNPGVIGWNAADKCSKGGYFGDISESSIEFAKEAVILANRGKPGIDSYCSLPPAKEYYVTVEHWKPSRSQADPVRFCVK